MNSYTQIINNIKELEMNFNIKNNALSDIKEITNDMRNRKAKLISLSFETKNLIEKNVLIYITNPRLITKEIYETLFNLTTELCSHSIRRDTILAYKIHQILCEVAKKNNDLENIIVETYHMSLALYYSESHIFKTRASNILKSLLPYFDMYDTLSLKAKDYFNRSMGNITMVDVSLSGDGIEDVIIFANKIIAFWEQERNKGIDQLPFDNYIFATYRNITMSLQFIRMGNHCTPFVLDATVKAATYVYDHIETIYQITSLPLLYTCKYTYYASLWHAGKMSDEDLLTNIKELCGEDKLDPYSSNSMWRALRMRIYYMLYSEYINGLKSEKYRQESEEIIKQIKTYLRSYEFEKLQSVIDYEILICINSLHTRLLDINDYDKLSYFSFIVDFNSYYRNTCVYEIGSLILNQLFQNQHDLVKEIEFNDFKQFYYICVNSADIGLQYFLKTSNCSYRDYFEEDKELIAFSIDRGDKIIRDNKLTDCYHLVCLNHLKDYSDRLALPKKENLAIDLIALSKCINLYTNPFMLSNNQAKSFDEAIKLIIPDLNGKVNPELINFILLPQVRTLLQYKVTTNSDKTLYESFKSFFEEKQRLIKESISLEVKHE